ncbi:Hsp20/alpha crystallin family protein [Aggregatimonas sangjinii]|uniref:Hsp20/alpha crystallin family protein n=1 Tax=Aggregatimonas sangjinii TaxID=2583587 RepID=A0A5B7STW3_9FLAO|nr:Hsp20/alpha crystallin family protein [Aggregatimonas sangjinii]QCX00779.1 Hsp20/alpha crystallin family protein [Aggregatimonas sangjinii]
MSLVKRNNVVFPSLMNEIFKPDWFGGMENFNTNSPAVNIKDGEKQFELELAVPGREKSDFNIDVDNDLLTVSYEVKHEENEDTGKYTRREFSFSSFERRFTLPESIDADKIEATYENGILKFVLPKKEEALPKPKRVIELS